MPDRRVRTVGAHTGTFALCAIQADTQAQGIHSHIAGTKIADCDAFLGILVPMELNDPTCLPS